MTVRTMIVEDEIFIALDLEDAVEGIGHKCVGIAGDSRTALQLAPEADLALVDLNLSDGPTGKALGRRLAEEFGITVLFITANPAQLQGGIPGTLGVLPKPVTHDDVKAAIEFALMASTDPTVPPPGRLQLFNRPAGGQAETNA